MRSLSPGRGVGSDVSSDSSSARSFDFDSAAESEGTDRFVVRVRENYRWSEALVDAIAAHANAAPIALADEYGPLYDAVDPNALDALFASSDATDRAATTGAVTFTYADRRITVETPDRIELVPLESSPSDR